ncbi:THAP domain-containing protein 5-like [Ylistrum balloti]|uniref:THAP domain-containing protein 5-like n=1 Tax=Ylistrum balloti TaxID=509963 RepID=UPI002905F370|nr:THAP domain-containing protein 5-like [Ylistrum balloti]
MVQCAALNCNNSSNRGQKVSLFAFPRDKKLRNAWKIKLKRDNFSPSDHTRLCESHFADDCFTHDRRLLESLGFTPGRKSLKPGSIPTIFDYSPKSRPTTPIQTEDSGTSPANARNDQHYPVGTTPSRSRSRPSTAVQKRRRLEILADVTNEQQISTNYTSEQIKYHPNQVHMETQTSDHRSTVDKCVGPDDPLETYNVGCQTSYNLTKRRHVSLQTKISEMKTSVTSCGVQATCQTVSTSIQCHRYNTTQKDRENYSDDESDMDISLPDQDNDSEWSPLEDLEEYSDLEDNVTTTHELDSEDTDPDKAHKS